MRELAIRANNLEKEIQHEKYLWKRGEQQLRNARKAHSVDKRHLHYKIYYSLYEKNKRESCILYEKFMEESTNLRNQFNEIKLDVLR